MDKGLKGNLAKADRNQATMTTLTTAFFLLSRLYRVPDIDDIASARKGGITSPESPRAYTNQATNTAEKSKLTTKYPRMKEAISSLSSTGSITRKSESDLVTRLNLELKGEIPTRKVMYRIERRKTREILRGDSSPRNAHAHENSI